VGQKKKTKEKDDYSGNDCANYFRTRESRPGHCAILTTNAQRSTPNEEERGGKRQTSDVEHRTSNRKGTKKRPTLNVPL
jgi:hypothetical protein